MPDRDILNINKVKQKAGRGTKKNKKNQQIKLSQSSQQHFHSQSLLSYFWTTCGEL